LFLLIPTGLQLRHSRSHPEVFVGVFPRCTEADRNSCSELDLKGDCDFMDKCVAQNRSPGHRVRDLFVFSVVVASGKQVSWWQKAVFSGKGKGAIVKTLHAAGRNVS
jgi:hypothetical protein